MGPETAQAGESSLKRAVQRLSELLEGAATVAQKAGQVGEAAKPIAEKLAPLVENIGRAILLLGPWLGV
jgi:hypothetical protein